jgi:hypothetical protein
LLIIEGELVIIKKRGAINYLSNAELLHEINESKKSYSYFIDPEYTNYTVIVHDLSEINDELISAAKAIKASQKNSARIRAYHLSSTPKAEIIENMRTEKLSDTDIDKAELVFRLMTFDHVPEEVKKIQKTLLNRIHFPPFKHYAFVDDELKEVGRSHWINGLENGQYSDTHGKMTNSLSQALIKLTNRYGSKANFAGYCVDDTTEALTQRGWFKYDQIEIGKDKILSLDTKTDHLSWSNINDVYIGNFEGNMFKLTGSTIDALVTPGHKFLDEYSNLKVVEEFKTGDKIKTMSKYDITYSEEFISTVEITMSPYNGIVWCPSTDYGNFVCRRGKKIYVTGNSYLDDMKGQALLQLSTVALQFDESKSNNPFAFYTSCIYTSFLKVLKNEKKQRTIRDDIMQEEAGISSHSHQLDYESE